MSSAGGDPRGPLTRRSFRIRHSIWLLGPILGLGMLTWAGFLYIGVRARRWSWVLPGIGYGIAISVIFYFVDGTEGPNGRENEWTGSAIIALWIGGIVHAMLVNRSWLRWRAAHRAPWYDTAPQAFAPAPYPPVPPPVAPYPTAPFPPAPPHRPPELAALDVDTARYWTPGRTVDAGAGRVLDLNTVQSHELAALPGMTLERVRRAMHERQARGGFGSVAEFADVVGLAPHEHVRIRDLVACSPRPPSGPSQAPGRVLDY